MTLYLLAQTTQPAAAIEAIKSWTAIALAGIAAIGTVGTAFLAMFALLVAKANAVRISAQHDRLEGQQAQISAVTLATPAPQTAVVAPPPAQPPFKSGSTLT